MFRRLSACCALLLLAGCPANDDGTEPVPDARGVTLRLLVADDPALAAAIEPLRGEWKGQTGYGLEVSQVTADELAAMERIAADAVIFPSHLLAVLAGKNRLAPLPPRLIEEEAAAWDRVFTLLRAHEAVWGENTIAVPFGSPVFTCYYRADLLERLGQFPPATWDDYQQLATLLADREKLAAGGEPAEGASAADAPWHGTMEPLGPGWGGLVLLARAAAYATHRDHYSTLFDLETMKPLVAGPPFVRALEEMLAAAGPEGAARLADDPAAVRAAFWRGECGMALTWPSAAVELPAAVPGMSVGFAELPGSQRTYHYIDKAWSTRRADENTHVTLVGVTGRLGGVTAESEWIEPACQLLLWLAGEQWGHRVSPKSASTTLYRQSHLEAPKDWVEEVVPAAAAAQYAEAAQQALSRPQLLFALRLPGHGEYLAALDRAVADAVRGEKKPQEAMSQAAEEWEEITKRLGRDQQRRAYEASLDL